MELWLILLLLALAAGAAVSYGHLRWNCLTATLFDRLSAAREPVQPTHVDLRELDGLPPPVQRYFRAVLEDGAPMVAGATVEHRGTFNTASPPHAPKWKPFTSRQRIVTRRPGFVWDARVAMLPGLAVLVHDASFAGLVTLADLRGTITAMRHEFA